MPSTSSKPSIPLLRAGAAVTAAVLLLGACGSAADSTAEDSAPSATASESTGAESTDAASESAESGTGVEENLPIYWAVETEQAGPRLIREFTPTQTDDALLAAANLVVSGTPADSDYQTLWPTGEVAGVTEDGSTITVELADNQWQERPADMDRAAARQAVQQMVYTLQAVAQDRLPVAFTVSGEPATVFGIDTAGGVDQDSPLQALNMVTITSPDQGATLDSGNLEVDGLANSFEANVVCQILQDGDVKSATPITAEGWMGEKLFPFTGEIPLDEVSPGAAQLRCSTDDPTGGVEGVGIFRDDKDITIS